MKSINKFLGVLFAIIIVVLCIGVILYVGNIIKTQNINNVLEILTQTKESKLATIVASSIIGVIAIIFGITIDGADSNGGTSLTLPLTSGNISISAQTFESIVINVTKKYNNIKNVKAKVDIREDGLYIVLFAYVLPGTIVSDVISKIQEDIKTTVLKQTTVEVKMVEVKIKGIYNQNDNNIQD